jgi:putative FmdB family regulatory protein
MPLYDYRCRRCGHLVEVLEKREDAGPLVCPGCDAHQSLDRLTRQESRRARKEVLGAAETTRIAKIENIENRPNRSLTVPTAFYVDGKERGSHGGRRVLARDVYEVSATVDGSLPDLFAETFAFRATGLADRPDHPARVQPGERRRIAVDGVAVWSDGQGFAHALLDAPAVAAAMRALGDRLQTIRVSRRPGRQQTDVAVTTAWLPAPCIALAEALVRAADDVVARALRFPLAYRRDDGIELFASREPSSAAVEDVMRAVAGRTAWLAGETARRGDAVEARVSLVEGAGEHAGVIRVHMLDATAASTEIALEGELPFVAGAPLYLAPERGVTGFLSSLFEEKVGDAAIDDAFLVRGNVCHAHAQCVLSAKDALLALPDATVEVGDGRIAALVPRARRTPAELLRSLDSVVDLWRCAVIARHGAVDQRP